MQAEYFENGGNVLEAAARRVFEADIDALKPGNVHRYAAGHDMRCEDFEASAAVTVPVLCDAGRGVGRRILDSVLATRRAVGCNTNLGMVLLMAPVAAAYQLRSGAKLDGRLRAVLAGLGPQDTREVYDAIRIAHPGGLGSAPRHDVAEPPDVPLREAMAAAADRDSVARQYANDFNDIREIGLGSLHEYHLRWKSVEWALTGCYLRFLAAFPDSHIQRKFGIPVAERVRQQAAAQLQQFHKKKNASSSKELLLEFDKELKNSGLNPGTSADLAAASFLLYQLGSEPESGG